jgi:tetratricopeptide (TPR) repeat protein
MRLRVTFLCLCLAPALTLAWADTIHLKNGRKILADRVRENGNRYEYEIGDDSYAIPKSSVDHVDAGGLPARSAAVEKLGELPAFSTSDVLAKEGDLVGKIVRDGKVDQDALAALEAKGNAVLSSTADFIAGKFEFERGNVAQSKHYFESALRYQPESSTILTYYAAVLARTGSAREALAYAERAVRSNPNSADAYTMLGYAQFVSDRTKDSITSWQHSISLRPDPAVQRLLAKAQREQSAESEFAQHESSHFVLHYEGKETSEAFREEIVRALESDYDDLLRDLGTPPHDNILVTLYTETAFFDVTHAPSWVGALYDGKLRIPISGLTSVTPELARVLKHELAHAFIAKLAAGRCPPWLNEGIAQFLEPKNLAGEGRQLALLYKAQQQIPFNVLEGSFMRLSGSTAHIAYAESLAAVTYISDSYGLSEIPRILERLSQGSSTEAALRGIVHSDYGQFELELGRHLADKYGD